jgi:DNA polymerase III sliding clamp (beta) subunit (PCNA family)
MKLTITPAQAGIIGKAIAPVLNKDTARPYCQVIELALGGDDETMTFTATDSYRAHRVTLAMTHGTEWGQTVLAVGADLVKSLASAAKVKNGYVTVSYDGTNLTVSTDTTSVTVPTYNGHFPDLDGILAGTCETELPANFDGTYFADAMTAGAVVAGKGNSVTVSCISPRKPCIITASSPDGELDLLVALMPQRTTGSK